VKHIGKPCAGKPLARFDERGQVSVTMIRLMRHRQTEGAETDRPGLPLRGTCSLLYPESDRVYRSFSSPLFFQSSVVLGEVEISAMFARIDANPLEIAATPAANSLLKLETSVQY
jgi:hypothetical protein